MRTPPRHLKPTKRNMRKTEKAIEAAKKAKLREAALMEKYEKQVQKDREKAQQTQQRRFRSEQAEKPSAPPKKETQPTPPTVPVSTVSKPAKTPARKKRTDVLFTVAGLIFLLIAVVTVLWQFGFLDKLFQKPVPAPTASYTASAERDKPSDSEGDALTAENRDGGAQAPTP